MVALSLIHISLGIFRVKETSLPPALAKPNDDLLFALTMTGLVLMAALDSANVGFVHFDRSKQHRLFRRRHCCPDPVAEIPSRLIGALVPVSYTHLDVYKRQD